MCNAHRNADPCCADKQIEESVFANTLNEWYQRRRWWRLQQQSPINGKSKDSFNSFAMKIILKACKHVVECVQTVTKKAMRLFYACRCMFVCECVYMWGCLVHFFLDISFHSHFSSSFDLNRCWHPNDDLRSNRQFRRIFVLFITLFLKCSPFRRIHTNTHIDSTQYKMPLFVVLILHLQQKKKWQKAHGVKGK